MHVKSYISLIYFLIAGLTCYNFYSEDFSSSLTTILSIALFSFASMVALILITDFNNSISLLNKKDQNDAEYLLRFIRRIIFNPFFVLLYFLPGIVFFNSSISGNYLILFIISSYFQLIVTTLAFLFLQDWLRKSGVKHGSMLIPMYTSWFGFTALVLDNNIPLVINPLGSMMGTPLLFVNSSLPVFITILVISYVLVPLIITYFVFKYGFKHGKKYDERLTG